ncbi:MAG: hypothetical protein HYS07_10385 [Chlamydiae bacterium]|nr:hypothetical protein [Chlamydiota bacterium]
MFKYLRFYGLILVSIFLNGCIYELPSWTPDGKCLVLGAFYKNEKGEDEYHGSQIAFFYHDSEMMANDPMELKVMNVASHEIKKLSGLTKEEEKSHYTLNP